MPTDVEGLRDLVEDLGDIDARDISTVPLGEDLVLRVGRYGPYVESTIRVEGEDPRRATVPDDIAPDELTPAKARELLEATADDGRVLGNDPVTGREIIARAGRYGPYVTEVIPAVTEPAAESALEPDAVRRRWRPEGSAGAVKVKPKKKAAKKAVAAKPRTASLFADMSLDTVTLERSPAAALPAPRRGRRPRVAATRSPRRTAATARTCARAPTPARSSGEEQLFTVTLEEALALYAQPKLRGPPGRGAAGRARRRSRVAGQPVVVKDGRFGAVRHGRRDQRHAAQGRRPDDRDPGPGGRAAGREARPAARHRSGVRPRRPRPRRHRPRRPPPRRPRRRPPPSAARPRPPARAREPGRSDAPSTLPDVGMRAGDEPRRSRLRTRMSGPSSRSRRSAGSGSPWASPASATGWGCWRSPRWPTTWRGATPRAVPRGGRRLHPAARALRGARPAGRRPRRPHLAPLGAGLRRRPAVRRSWPRSRSSAPCGGCTSPRC